MGDDFFGEDVDGREKRGGTDIAGLRVDSVVINAAGGTDGLAAHTAPPAVDAGWFVIG